MAAELNCASHSAVTPSYKRCSSFQRGDQVSVVFYTLFGLCSDFFSLFFFFGGGRGVGDGSREGMLVGVSRGQFVRVLVAGDFLNYQQRLLTESSDGRMDG